MPLDLGTISTGVDAFIKLIRDSRRIDMNEAASKIGLSRQVLEEWAAVLEEQGLIRIEYQLTRVYLIWVAQTKAELELKGEEITDKRATAVRLAESQLEEVMELSGELDTMRGEFAMISEAFEVKMGGIKTQLERMHELKREKEELNFRVAELSKEFGARTAALRRQVEEDAGKVGSSGGMDRELGERLKALEPQMRRLRVLRDEADAYIENVNRKAAEIMEALEAREKEYEELRERAGALQRGLKGTDAKIRGFRSELERRVGELEELGKESDEGLKRATGSLEKMIPEAGELTKDFDARMEKLKRTGAELKRLNAEKKEIGDYLQKIIVELKALDFSKGAMTTDDVLKRIGETKGRIAEAGKRRDRYAHKQKELRASMRRMWKLEEEKGK